MSPERSRATATRTRTAGAELVPAVLEAARRIIEAEGPDALAIRRVAAEAGVAPMSIYNRFGNKLGIIEALFQQGFEELTAQLRALPRSNPADGAEDMRVGLRCYRRFALEHPAVYAVMFQHTDGFEPGEAAIGAAMECLEGLTLCVQRGMDLGVFAPGDATATAQLIWGSCHGVVSLELGEIGCPVLDRAVHYDALIELLVAGLRKTSAS